MEGKKQKLDLGRLPNIMPNYPHMLNEDRDLWTLFLKNEEFEIDRVWYDIHVGIALPVKSGYGSMEYKISQGVTRKRIDVICTVGDELWIMEIKPHANMKALGQIIIYEKLFREEFEYSGKIVPVILCWTIDPDIAVTMASIGVRILHPVKAN